MIHIIFFNFLKFLVELTFCVITATATVVINFSTTALEPQLQFSKIPQPKQELQPWFSENSQPIHHYYSATKYDAQDLETIVRYYVNNMLIFVPVNRYVLDVGLPGGRLCVGGAHRTQVCRIVIYSTLI